MIWTLLILSGLIWVYLMLLHGQFWHCDQRLDADHDTVFIAPKTWPRVIALVPARNEADVIEKSLLSLIEQDYAGPLDIVVTDDASDDSTAAILAGIDGRNRRIEIVHGSGPEPGWSGKLYALEQAKRRADETFATPVYYWLTDADIAHDKQTCTRLVTQAENGFFDMVSVIVRLQDRGFWPGLLIPAFVFFFQMLYPFRQIKDHSSAVAGAAGGCILIDRHALDKIGGFSSIKGALIDDCALAARIKAQGGRLWLGLSKTQYSIRLYAGLADIWRMVARTAFTQLHYDPLRLIGACLGMVLVFLTPIIAVLVAIVTTNLLLCLVALTLWSLMAVAYAPMIKWFGRPWEEAFLLPFAACIYTLMTLDSARRHWQGQGGLWKGRHQSELAAKQVQI